MTEAYMMGFCKAAEEHGIDPRALMKFAQKYVQPTEHTVANGEVLGRIARQYGLNEDDLARWNKLKNKNFIRVGQKLRLTSPVQQVPADQRWTIPTDYNDAPLPFTNYGAFEDDAVHRVSGLQTVPASLKEIERSPRFLRAIDNGTVNRGDWARYSKAMNSAVGPYMNVRGKENLFRELDDNDFNTLNSNYQKALNAK